MPLEVESAGLGLGLVARPLGEPRAWGSPRVEALERPWRAGARGGQQVGPRAGLRPPHPPRWSATAQPRPLFRARARLVAALVARRGPGRWAPVLPAAAAAAAVLPAARAGRAAEAIGARRWEAARPRVQAVAKFPRRSYQGARLPTTRDCSEKGSEIFNLEN